MIRIASGECSKLADGEHYSIRRDRAAVAGSRRLPIVSFQETLVSSWHGVKGRRPRVQKARTYARTYVSLLDAGQRDDGHYVNYQSR